MGNEPKPGAGTIVLAYAVAFGFWLLGWVMILEAMFGERGPRP